MARIDDQGNLDYEFDNYYNPPDPLDANAKFGGNPTTSGPYDNPNPDVPGVGGAGGYTGGTKGITDPQTKVVTPPTTGPVDTSGQPVNTTTPSKTSDYLMSLIKGGLSAKDAAAKYNTDNKTTEAMYYDPSDRTSGHATIGLPGGYLTDEDQWSKFTERGPEGGGGASTGTASNSLDGVMGGLMGGTGNPDSAALRARINGLLDSYSKPVDPNDPLIAARTSAYEGDTARSLKNFQEFAAERGHAEGTPSGAFDSQLGNAVQAGGRAVGDFRNNLIDSETKSRRAALSSALGQDIGLTGLDNQDTQFYDNLGFNISKEGNNLDSILAQLLLSGGGSV